MSKSTLPSPLTRMRLVSIRIALWVSLPSRRSKRAMAQLTFDSLARIDRRHQRHQQVHRPQIEDPGLEVVRPHGEVDASVGVLHQRIECRRARLDVHLQAEQTLQVGIGFDPARQDAVVETIGADARFHLHVRRARLVGQRNMRRAARQVLTSAGSSCKPAVCELRMQLAAAELVLRRTALRSTATSDTRRARSSTSGLSSFWPCAAASLALARISSTLSGLSGFLVLLLDQRPAAQLEVVELHARRRQLQFQARPLTRGDQPAVAIQGALAHAQGEAGNLVTVLRDAETGRRSDHGPQGGSSTRASLFRLSKPLALDTAAAAPDRAGSSAVRRVPSARAVCPRPRRDRGTERSSPNLRRSRSALPLDDADSDGRYVDRAVQVHLSGLPGPRAATPA